MFYFNFDIKIFPHKKISIFKKQLKVSISCIRVRTIKKKNHVSLEALTLIPAAAGTAAGEAGRVDSYRRRRPTLHLSFRLRINKGMDGLRLLNAACVLACMYVNYVCDWAENLARYNDDRILPACARAYADVAMQLARARLNLVW